MSRLAPVVAAALAAALALAGCAAPRTVLFPAPPAEVRKEAEGPAAPAAAPTGAGAPQEAGAPGPPAEGPAAPVPEPPDPLVEYTTACDRTQAAIARGAAAEAVPSWQPLEETKWGTDAVFNQGVLFQMGGNLDAAVARYARAAERSPGFEPPLANLLGVSLLRGDGETVNRILARVAPPGPPPAAAMLPELAVNVAAALMETGRRDDAAALLRALRSRGKATPALAWNLAVLAYRSGDTAAARHLASALPPGVANLYPVIASRFAWAGEGEKIPALGPAPAGMPGMAALSANLRAYGDYRGGSAAAAEKALAPEAALPHAPAEILSNIGLLQAEQGRWGDARRNLERAARENPSLPAAWLNLGIFREIYEGNPSGARECYENYVKLGGSRKEEVRTWSDRLGQSVSPRP